MTLSSTDLRMRIPVVAFLVIWLGYFGMLSLFNFRSAYDNMSTAILWQLAFVGLVSAPILLFPGRRADRPAAGGDVNPWVIGLSIGISAVAICSLAFDKWRIGIDYSQGVCYARYEMTRLGLERTGVSSIFSVFGNLFGSSFFVAAAAVITQRCSRRTAYVGLILAFICLMALSVVAASRSIIMLYTAMCVACVCIRYASNVPAPRVRWFDLGLPVLMLVGAVYFVVADFNCRAGASNMTATTYMQDFAPVLGAQVDTPAQDASAEQPAPPAVSADASTPVEGLPAAPAEEPIVPAAEQEAQPGSSESESSGLDVLVADKVTGLGGMAVLYLVHSAYTFAAILSLPPEEARVMFTHPLEMLARIGLIDPPNSNWALAGRFTSLPGGLYHDFGPSGVVVGSIVLGLLGIGAGYLLRRFSTNIFAVGVVAGLYSILYLSPIHFALDFAVFPFVCVAFVVVTAGAWLISAFKGRGAARTRAATHAQARV